MREEIISLDLFGLARWPSKEAEQNPRNDLLAFAYV